MENSPTLQHLAPSLSPPGYSHSLPPVPWSPRSDINAEPEKVRALSGPEGILI